MHNIRKYKVYQLLTHYNYLGSNLVAIIPYLNKLSYRPEYCTMCNIVLFLYVLPKLKINDDERIFGARDE